MKLYQGVFKIAFDSAVSIILLIVLSPLILITCVLLVWTNKGDLFFLQPRPGKFGKIFKIIKFKTMRDAFDEEGNALPDYMRITSIGRFVRSASLDEILQLINVIKGDMSLVGPRPLLIEYLPLYDDNQKRRHDVKPGITGWAQVNGRNAISWQQKFELDVWYVDHISFLFDLKILWLTLRKVIKGDGVNAEGEVTMSKFSGNSK